MTVNKLQKLKLELVIGPAFMMIIVLHPAAKRTSNATAKSSLVNKEKNQAFKTK